MTLPVFANLRPPTRRLVLARGFRSVGQGALVVDFTLYLNALHWSAAAIGLLLSASGLFGAVLTLFIGIGSDRVRRKPFLLTYEAIAVAGSLVAIVTAQPALLSIAAVLCAFGRGANGAAGPFSPAEQAWLAEQVESTRRGPVYSLNSALGFFGMAVGAGLSALPPYWEGMLPGPLSYRPLFLIVTLASIANLWLLAGTEEGYRRQSPAGRRAGGRAARPVDERAGEREVAPAGAQDAEPSGARGAEPIAAQGAEPIAAQGVEPIAAQGVERAARSRENGILGRLVAVNAFNGVAIGLVGPLISYWFARKFGIGPASIGPVFAITFVVTGLSALMTGSLSGRLGVVRSVVWARLVGLVLLVLLPLMPVYWLAALVYLLRSALNRGTAGVRQALAIGLVREHRRGLASSLNMVSMQFPRSIGPTIAGLLLSAGMLAFPFYAAALLQGAYLLLYRFFFLRYDTPST